MPLSGSQLVIQALEKEGVDTIFALAGDHILPLLDALADTKIRIIDTRHEQAAVHMADAWARITGSPGVCLFTTPGHANAIPGLANAMSTESPVLCITGSASLANYNRGIMQEIDQINMAKPVTKGSWLVHSANRIPDYISMALRTAFSDRRGPVHLTIPEDVQRQEVADGSVAIYGPNQYRGVGPVTASEAQIKEAVDLLHAAKQPVIVASSPAAYGDSSTALQQFIETTKLPLMTEEAARGLVSDDHPYCLGFFDLSQGQAPTHIRQSDLVLFLGKKLDYTINYGRSPVIPDDAKVIQIDPAAAEIGKNRGVDMGILGDIGPILEQLTEEAKTREWVELPWIDTLRAARAADAERRDSLATAETPMHAMFVIKTLEDFLGPDDTVVFDGGNFCYFGRAHIPAKKPRKWWYLPNLGMLGIAVPVAIAAKAANPDTRVVAVTGDGAFGFQGMELDTAVRHGINTVTIVGTDAAWGIDKDIQIGLFGRPVITDLAPTRYDIVAQGLGAHAEYVEKPEELVPALERAFAANKPALVNVRIREGISPRAESIVASRKSGGSA